MTTLAKVAVVAAVLVALVADGGHAQAPDAGTAVNAIGTLVVVRPDGIENRLRGKGAVRLFEEDVLRTDPGSQGLIELKDGITVALNENTVVKLVSRWERTRGMTPILRVKEGEVWVKTGAGPKNLEVETPVAWASGKDSEFNMKVERDGQSVLTVFQGVAEFGTPFGTCPIRTGTVSYGVRGKRCTKPEPTDVAPVLKWSRQVLP